MSDQQYSSPGSGSPTPAVPPPTPDGSFAPAWTSGAGPSVPTASYPVTGPITDPAAPAQPAPAWPQAPYDPQARLAQPAAPTGSPRQRHLSGLLVAILACLVVSIVLQGATLALIAPRMLAATYPTRLLQVSAISTTQASVLAVSTEGRPTQTAVPDGQTVTVPVSVASGSTLVASLTADSPRLDYARITCIISDEKGAELVNVSVVVGDSPTVTCSWTNDHP